MSGVWVFNNGVIRLVENPNQSGGVSTQSHGRRNVLVYLPTGEAVSSYSSLEQILRSLGWERYFSGDSDLIQYHKRSSIDLISLPRDFSKFNSVYMYDIVVKNPNSFHVRDFNWNPHGINYPRPRGLVCVSFVQPGNYIPDIKPIISKLEQCEYESRKGRREDVCSCLNSRKEAMTIGLSSLS